MARQLGTAERSLCLPAQLQPVHSTMKANIIDAK
jgi:hypothetical protein